MASLRTRLTFSALLLSAPAWATDVDISGTYKDLDGTEMEFIQSGTNLLVKPKLDELPPEMKAVIGEIRMKGTVSAKADDGFSLDANYDQTFEPVPGQKVKVKIAFDASGQKRDEGLAMKECAFKMTAIVFANGEIAGSQNHEEKCVGLWKKQR